jgi:hypothetical protein
MPRKDYSRKTAHKTLAIGLGCALTVSWGHSANAQTAQATEISKDEQVSQLIELLGDDSFARRETAGEQLRGMGERALPLLTMAAKSGESAEIRARANNIRNEIDKEVFQRVSRNFVLDTNPDHEYGLPGWKAFQEIVGFSRCGKQLFLRMLTDQPVLVASVEANLRAKGSANEVAARNNLIAVASACAQDLRAGLHFRFPELGDTVSLLTACAILGKDVPVELDDTVLASLGRGEVAEYFAKTGYDRCLRSLTGKWIANSHDMFADRALASGLQLNIPEVVAVARKHLTAADDEYTRDLAFHCLARYGTVEDIALLEPLMSDETIMHEFASNRFRYSPSDIKEEDNSAPPMPLRNEPIDRKILEQPPRMIVRASDIAVAVAMLLSGDEITSAFPRYQPNGNHRDYIPADLAFSDREPEAHRNAIARWKELHGKKLSSN